MQAAPWAARKGRENGYDSNSNGNSRAAVARGLGEMAFTDHIPLYFLPPADRDPKLAMREDQLDDYLGEVAALQREFAGSLPIRLGLEADEQIRHELRPDRAHRADRQRHLIEFLDGACLLPRGACLFHFQIGSLEDEPALLVDATGAAPLRFPGGAVSGELGARMAIVKIVERRQIRYAHMVGVTAEIMMQGMRADYRLVDRLSSTLCERMRSARAASLVTHMPASPKAPRFLVGKKDRQPTSP